jgi:hypothetical protein
MDRRLVVKWILLLIVCPVVIPACGGRGQTASTEPELTTQRIQTLRPIVTSFCGDCHAMPPPDSFPRDAWFAEVEQGYRFYLESGRHDLKPPPTRDAVAFYRAQAPEALVTTPLATDLDTAARFRKQLLPALSTAPAVSFVDAVSDRGTSGLWFCDMHSGQLFALDCRDTSSPPREMARFTNPARFAVCDLDGNGSQDTVVADLGSFVPGDHQHGKVWWLPAPGEADQPARREVLVENIGRIADVRPADFNQDGFTDLVVAEFGWRKSGSVFLLLQEPPSDPTAPRNALPRFRRVDVDQRHGVIHVPVCDLNGDGRPDFVALVSQEHEVVDAFLNIGEGKFERQRIFTANDPAFGSSGIDMVDLDGDGDLDVLFTNGDTLDSHYLKPSHGIHWLENQGGFPFVAKRIAHLLGAMRAVPADIDGDGDLDVVAAAYLPALLRRQGQDTPHETLIWLEQTASREFIRHTLEVGEAGHMSLLAADLDGDGDVDLAVPNYAEQREAKLEPLVIWWNEPSR